MMQCGASDLHLSSEVTDSCTMTTPLPIHPIFFRQNFLAKHQKPQVPQPPPPTPFTRQGHMRLFSVPKGESGVEGEEE